MGAVHSRTNVSAPVPKGTGSAQDVALAAPSHAVDVDVANVTATSVAHSADAPAGSATRTSAHTTPAATSSTEQWATKIPRVVKAPMPTAGPSVPSVAASGTGIVLPTYPSAKNNFRGGRVLKTCKRPLSGKNIYIEISDDSEDN